MVMKVNRERRGEEREDGINKISKRKEEGEEEERRMLGEM